MKHPQYLRRFTNTYIYDYLPDGVLEELRVKKPKIKKGNRTKRHHQFLSGDIGIPHLEKHITKIITIMELSDNQAEFKEKFSKVFEKYHQPSFKFD